MSDAVSGLQTNDSNGDPKIKVKVVSNINREEKMNTKPTDL